MKKILQATVMLLILVVIAIVIHVWSRPSETNEKQTDQMPQITKSESTDGFLNSDINLQITVLDVGKADCILILAGESVMMIDTGEKKNSDRILAYLSQKGISSLDYLVITHFDKDHVGGAANIIGNLNIGQIIQPDYEKNSKQFYQYIEALESSGIEPLYLHEALQFSLGQAEVLIDPPEKDAYTESNNYSLICTMKLKECSFLFMGDAEEIRTAEFLESNKNQYNFLKVPGHGKLNSLSEKLLQQVNPEYVAITSSGKNPADPEMLNLLKQLDAKIYQTTGGDITFYSDGEKIQVSQ